eukprot:scaffold296960_cov42-Attheya_sp.AAC.1
MRLEIDCTCMSVGYMFHTSSDAATTRSDHVRRNDSEGISIAVGDIGCGWWVVVAEPWGVGVGVEGAMVSRLLLLIIVCVCGVAEVGLLVPGLLGVYSNRLLSM